MYFLDSTLAMDECKIRKHNFSDSELIIDGTVDRGSDTTNGYIQIFCSTTHKLNDQIERMGYLLLMFLITLLFTGDPLNGDHSISTLTELI